MKKQTGIYNSKSYLSRYYRRIAPTLSKLRSKFYASPPPKWQDIPVIINNFNRLAFLQQQIESFSEAGIRNIYIIDNNSTYPPLLDYYKNIPHQVFYLKENVGHLSLWKTDICFQFIHSYYVYTDPDVIPIAACPSNYMQFFLETLFEYPEIDKVGFSLCIDDIPDFYLHKKAVLEVETPYWQININDKYFQAPIDTTFALYKPYSYGGWEIKALRTAPPYCAKHLPWYVDFNNLSDEEHFYISTARKDTTTWSNIKVEI